MHLVGVVVSCVVEVVADCRGQHDQQVDAVHLTPQVSQPDQTIHLLRDRETVKNRLQKSEIITFIESVLQNKLAERCLKAQ